MMLEGEPGTRTPMLRTEYSTRCCQEAGVELRNWEVTPETGRGVRPPQKGQWLEEFGDQIEAVIANNDDMALGAIDAYGQTDWELPLVVGVDATAPALQAVAGGNAVRHGPQRRRGDRTGDAGPHTGTERCEGLWGHCGADRGPLRLALLPESDQRESGGLSNGIGLWRDGAWFLSR